MMTEVLIILGILAFVVGMGILISLAMIDYATYDKTSL